MNLKQTLSPSRLLGKTEPREQKTLKKVSPVDSHLTRESKRVTQNEYFSNAQKILDEKRQLLVESDPNVIKPWDKNVAAFETLELIHCVDLIQKGLDVTQLPPEERPHLFFMHELLLRKCAKLIRFNGHEQGLLVTGVNVGNLHVLTDFYYVDNNATAVSIEALPEMLEPTLREMAQVGLDLDAVVHCHPGGGPQGPSGIDLNTHESLEKIGPILGAVFTNDGYITFYAKDLDFHVKVQGKNVKHVEENVWRLL